jgi:hypothetical protein
MKRSLGVTIFGILFFIFAVIMFLQLPALSFNGKVGAFIAIILNMTCGVGVLFLFNWARKLVIYFMALGIILGLFLYSNSIAHLLKTMPAPSLAMAHLITILRLALEAFIIYYFTRPKVKEQCG